MFYFSFSYKSGKNRTYVENEQIPRSYLQVAPLGVFPSNWIEVTNSGYSTHISAEMHGSSVKARKIGNKNEKVIDIWSPCVRCANKSHEYNNVFILPSCAWFFSFEHHSKSHAERNLVTANCFIVLCQRDDKLRWTSPAQIEKFSKKRRNSIEMLMD